MPIGPITPGSYVTVTPDASPGLYTSVQAPTATMPVVGADIQALTLVSLNIQKALDTAKANIAGAAFTGAVSVAGAFTTSGRRIRRPRVNSLTDGDKTFDVSQGDVFAVRNNPAALRTITLKSTGTGTTPVDGESIEIIVNGPLAALHNYDIKREDGTIIASFWGTDTISNPTWTSVQPMARFDFVGGVWRLGMNTGAGGPSAIGANEYGGVIPGPGA